jgi:hypothetical protein
MREASFRTRHHEQFTLEDPAFHRRQMLSAPVMRTWLRQMRVQPPRGSTSLEQLLKLFLEYVLCLGFPLGAVRTEQVVESFESCWLSLNLHGKVLECVIVQGRPCVPGIHAT